MEAYSIVEMIGSIITVSVVLGGILVKYFNSQLASAVKVLDDDIKSLRVELTNAIDKVDDNLNDKITKLGETSVKDDNDVRQSLKEAESRTTGEMDRRIGNVEGLHGKIEQGWRATQRTFDGLLAKCSKLEGRFEEWRDRNK